jgi:hypothetical protein
MLKRAGQGRAKGKVGQGKGKGRAEQHRAPTLPALVRHAKLRLGFAAVHARIPTYNNHQFQDTYRVVQY